MSPLRQIAFGAVLGMVVLGVPMACGSSGTLTPLMRCKLDSLKVLPQDLGNVTVYDAIDIYERVRACHQAADAGL